MKVSGLIKNLEALKDKHGDLQVVVDYDENGWWNTEKVSHVENNDDDGESFEFINIKSSSEL